MGDHRALIPAGWPQPSPSMPFSPGVQSGDHVFVTGMTGSRPDGTIATTVDEQIDAAFDKIAAVLAEAAVGLDAIVEITSFHVGLSVDFDRIAAAFGQRLTEPYPAWTAVEVAGLRRPGALVEIRVTAAVPRKDCATPADRSGKLPSRPRYSRASR